MNISSWAIRQPIPSILLFIVLTVLGLQSWQKANIENFPDITLPMITVNVAWPGASPEQLETEVARKIENATVSLNHLKHVRSVLAEGSATVMVEFELEKDISEAMEEVRNAVASVRSDFPTTVLEPTISKASLGSGPIANYAISSSSMDEIDLSWFVDNRLSKALMNVRGVGQIQRTGGLSREIRVELNSAQMAGLGITAADVSQVLGMVQQDAPGGRAQISAQEQNIRVLGTAKNVADIQNITIPLPSGGQVRLGDIARVQDGASDRSSGALMDGKNALVFSVTGSKGSSEITVLHDVREAIKAFQATHPNVEITEISETVKPIQDNYDDSINLMLEGALLAVLVVGWFLRDWRATLVSAVALPLSIIPTFWFMSLFGFSLNVVTLLALSLVIGVLVDDAIVEVENIVRHMRMGKTAYQAAMEGADEIGMAVIATTATLVAVFLPTAFMGGIVGKFFVQFGWTAAIAVLVSLLVARLLTPMMAAYCLKSNSYHQVNDGRLMTLYLKAVKKCLAHPWLTGFYSVLFFVVSMGLAIFLPGEFIPQGDIGRTVIAIELPPGYTLSQTQKVAEQVREKIKDMPEITRIYTALGSGQATDILSPPSSGEVRKAVLNITLTPHTQRNRTQPHIEAALREQVKSIAGARITVGSAESTSYYILTLSGDDPEDLARAAQSIEHDLRTIAGIGTINSSANVINPALIITPDFAKASAAGVSTQDLANTIRIATNGDYLTAVTKLNLPERQIPLNVQMSSQERQDLSAIANLKIRNRSGELVPLSAVATIRMGAGANTINRFDRQRNIDFTIEPNGIPIGALSHLVFQLPAVKSLPSTIHLKEFGDAEASAELAEGFSVAMLSGLGAIYIVLVLLFHNFTQPVTILVALPLSAGGAFGALFIAQLGLSMPAMIGLIMLMGIVTKNSILLVDYALIAHRRGLSRIDAVLDACHKRSRPILMTTIAMAAGMLPNAIGFGADPSFRMPMAVVVIGGLITSTFLSLLVIPVVYLKVNDLQERVFNWFKR